MMQTSNRRCLILVGFYIVYLVIGACVFSAIEAPVERERVSAVMKVRDEFLKDHETCMTGSDILHVSVIGLDLDDVL